MNKTTLALSFIALTAAAQAGDYYPMPVQKQVVPAPECSLQWFLGASGGYLTDYDEPMYHLQFGAEKVCKSACCTHGFYLELGYTESDEDYGRIVLSDIDFDITSDAEIIPLTLNYKYECYWMDKFNWYIGAGAGVAFTDLEVSAGPLDESDDETVFYAQIFTGLSYNFTEHFEIFGGARYIYMDDPDLTGFSDFDDTASIDGDVLLELGLRWNF
ncbi:hypothetical protein Rhal01_03803 [Rubritalea halochordaticola]|uniref:Outer membrane protein beta-barrel domain-containing protein n=1 Tax=Rubritalea halochordaticola TaxID=714537 RepID=A0ABP9V4M0_9BACT